MAISLRSLLRGTKEEKTPGEEMLTIAGQGLGFFNAAKQLGDQYDVERSQQRLMDLARERGGDLGSLSFNDVGTISDMKALGLLQEQQSNNEVHRREGMQNRFLADTEHYNRVIYPRMSLLQQSYQNQDWDGFAENVEQLNNSLGTPYRLKRNADGTGFDMYFRKNGQGFVNTGRGLSNQEVFDMANKLAAGNQYVVTGLNGEKQVVNPNYNLWAEQQRMATAKQNISNALSPSFMLGPDKQVYRAVFQNNWADYNADSQVVLFNQNGQKVGVFNASDLGRQGFILPNAQSNFGGMVGASNMGIQQPTTGRRRGGNAAGMSMGAGIGNAALMKQYAPNIYGPQGKGGGGGRGRRGGGGQIIQEVPANTMGTSQQGWRNLTTQENRLINGLSTVQTEDGKIAVDKGLATITSLMVQQSGLSPQEASRQARLLVGQYGYGPVLQAAQAGQFAPKRNVPQQTQAQVPNEQQQAVVPATQPQNKTASRIGAAVTRTPQGTPTQQPPQQTQLGPFDQAFKEARERSKASRGSYGFGNFMDDIGVRPLIEGVGNAFNRNQGAGLNDATVSEGGGNRGMYVAGDPAQIEGLVTMGNIDLASRPRVRNADGTISTVRSMSFGMDVDGKPVQVLIPTVSPDGRNLTPQQAIEFFRQTGQHLGMFDSIPAANKYAQNLHLQQERMYR